MKPMANDRDVLCLIDRLLARMARAIDYEVDPRELEEVLRLRAELVNRLTDPTGRRQFRRRQLPTLGNRWWDWKQRFKTRRELEHDATRNGALEPLSKG